MLHFIYDHLIAHGFPPSLRDIATHNGTSVSEARAAVANLKVGKTVLPHPVTGEIWMAVSCQLRMGHARHRSRRERGCTR